MWPFRRKPLIPHFTARWLLDNFAWLIRNHATHSRFASSVLVLPDKAHLPLQDAGGHELALALFAQIKSYCGLADSQVPLVEGGPILPSSGNGHDGHAAGTYTSGGRQGPYITYATNLLDDRPALVATLAHELGHHLLHRGSQERMLVETSTDEERLTDLAAIFMGFGVFLSNSAFHMKREGDYWTYRYHGYLSESEVIFATALFITVKRLDPRPALRHLKSPRSGMLKRALRDLEDYGDAVATMRLLVPPPRRQDATHLRLVK
jgi:hypothetical protein